MISPNFKVKDISFHPIFKPRVVGADNGLPAEHRPAQQTKWGLRDPGDDGGAGLDVNKGDDCCGLDDDHHNRPTNQTKWGLRDPGEPS